MSKVVTVGALPRPPKNYDPNYMAQLVSVLEKALAQIGSVGAERVQTLVITAVPTSSAGLPAGSVWSDAGDLKITS